MQLTTQRLKLRPVRPDDAEAVYSYRSDRQTNRFQGWIPETVHEVEQWICQQPT